jgi:hypothetical protein
VKKGSGRGSEEVQGFRGQHIACTSNLVYSFHRHARQPRGERSNRRKGLGDTRNSGPREFPTSYYYYPTYLSIYLPGSRTSLYISTSSPSSFQPRDPSLDTATDSPAFVSRMSTFPFVDSALRVYEQGKASSRVVKVRLLILIHCRNVTRVRSA